MENYPATSPADKTMPVGNTVPVGNTGPVGHDTSNTATVPNSGPQKNTIGTGGTSPGDVHASTGTTEAGVGNKIKGMAAQGLGLSETVRGSVNAAMDSMFGDKEGQAKNEEIARKGKLMMDEKKFSPTGSDERVV